MLLMQPKNLGSIATQRVTTKECTKIGHQPEATDTAHCRIGQNSH